MIDGSLVCVYIYIYNIMFTFITIKFVLFSYCTQEWEGNGNLSSLMLVSAPHK